MRKEKISPNQENWPTDRKLTAEEAINEPIFNELIAQEIKEAIESGALIPHEIFDASGKKIGMELRDLNNNRIFWENDDIGKAADAPGEKVRQATDYIFENARDGTTH